MLPSRWKQVYSACARGRSNQSRWRSTTIFQFLELAGAKPEYLTRPQGTLKRLISGIDQCGMLPRVERPSDRFGWFGDSSASAWTLAFCGALIAATLACTHRPPRLSSPLSVTPVRFVARFQTLLQPPLVTRASGGTTIDVAISPDGTRLAYVGRRGSTQQLYTRAVSDLEVIPIPGTEDAVSPFFSPDGNWVGFGAVTS